MQKKWFVVGTLALCASTAQAQATAPVTLTYQANTANSPVYVNRLRVTQVDTNAYAIDLSIVAPNPSHHTGHIQGLATREGNRLTLREPIFKEDGTIDDPSLCTLVVDIHDKHANVVSADQCSGFGGAATNFVEQGRNLLRLP